jgi:hypothetical protein
LEKDGEGKGERLGEGLYPLYFFGEGNGEGLYPPTKVGKGMPMVGLLPL